MTAVAPASLSISAAISPVNAPDASAWQSWPPMATEEPRACAAKAATSVAGGHTIRSARPARPPAPAMTLVSSAAEPARPFIFQLPAIRGSGAPAMPQILAFCRLTQQSQRLAEQQSACQGVLRVSLAAIASVAGSGRHPYDARP